LQAHSHTSRAGSNIVPAERRGVAGVARRAPVRIHASRLLALIAWLSSVACNRTPPLAGMWDATVTAGNARVPFRLLISGSGATLQGSFFNGDQQIVSTLKSRERLRAFVQRYAVAYPVLVAGDLRLVHARVPQAVNLEVFPTTFSIGRDGLVRGVRTGFAGEPTGPFHASLKAAVTAEVEQLLAER
jgi:hypothetical protein